MDIIKKFIKQASAETPRKIELFKDEDSGRLMFLNQFRQKRIITDLSAEEYQTLLQLLLNNVQDSVVIVDTFLDLQSTVGDNETIYIVRGSTAMYFFDTTLNDYVLLNDPNIVNPDAPEEGTTFFVKMSTAAKLKACTYNNGTAGVGATLTGNVNGVVGDIVYTTKIDNITPLLNDVILVRLQDSAIENGIYEITQLGDGSNPFILTRIDGYNETAEVYPSVVFVEQGASNANRYFTQTTVNPVFGTNGLVFTIAAANSIVIPTFFVDTATSSPLPACTYYDGTVYPSQIGWGAILQSTTPVALGSINGVAMTSGKRIVVKDQVNPAHNGTYYVSNAGSTTQAWTLTRSMSNSAMFYNNREFVVSNINSTLFGNRYTVTSPLTMLNSAWGTTAIVFTKNIADTNLANTNLIFTGNRTHDLATFSLKFQYDTNNDLTYNQNFTTQRTASGSFGGYITHNDNGNQAKVALRAGSNGTGFIDSKDRLIINANWDGNGGSASGYSGGAVNSIVIGNVFSNGNVGFGWSPNVGIPYRVSVNGDFGLFSTADSLVKLLFNPTTGSYIINNMPTLSAGLPSGSLWNDSGTVKIV